MCPIMPGADRCNAALGVFQHSLVQDLREPQLHVSHARLLDTLHAGSLERISHSKCPEVLQ